MIFLEAVVLPIKQYKLILIDCFPLNKNTSQIRSAGVQIRMTLIVVVL